MVLGQMLLRTTTESGFNKSFREELDRERTSGTRGFDILSRNVRFETFSASSNLSIIHFQNNQLTGSVPSYLSSLPKLTELYLQNNKLSGYIPKALKSRGIIFNYAGNMDLKAGSQEKHHIIISISALLGMTYKGGPARAQAAEVKCAVVRNRHRDLPSLQIMRPRRGDQELLEQDRLGGFGIVYYGKMPDGREIAVKPDCLLPELFRVPMDEV
ncbi:putative LRR receptor-like serine/threonine-protein kinase [Hordeum vulgare]|nr:putative LRR receptor-like serine/threonine-protein kinase [Hordeum vulgare]